MTTEHAPYDDFDDFADDCCPNCGGEGVVYDCVSEYACIDPESGCDMCERRCDWCNPKLRASSPSE
jgi:hypothetical protein